MSARTPSPVEESDVESIYSAQSESLAPNEHGKRKRKVPQAPIRRTGQWYNEVLAELTNWRKDVRRSAYGNSSCLSLDVIMPNQTLLDIAKNVKWRTPEKLGAEWLDFTRYGEGLCEKLHIIDQKYDKNTRITRRMTRIAACNEDSAEAAGNPDAVAAPLTSTVVYRPRAALPPKCRAPLVPLEGVGIFQVKLESPGPSFASTNDEMTRVFRLSSQGASTTQMWTQIDSASKRKITKITAATLSPRLRPRSRP